MTYQALRRRLLPLNAWRAILLAVAMALPLRHGFLSIAAETAPPSAAAALKKSATAAELISRIDAGLALAAKGAQQAKLDPKAAQTAPFFAASKAVATQAATLRKQLAAKDPAYFQTLSQMAASVGELRIAAPRVGVTNRDLNAGVGVVFGSFDALRTGFGKEAARRKQGGSLTAKEKAVFAKLKAEQKALVAQVAPLRAKALKAGDKRLAADLGSLLKQSQRAITSKETLAGFLSLLGLVDGLAGQYQAYSYYVPKAYRAAWAPVRKGVAASNDTYWSYYDSYPVSDWSYYETASYSYESTYEVSMSSTEVSEYDAYFEESETSELSDDTYIDEADYEDDLDENEDEQEETADEEDDSGDEEDASGDEEDASGDEEDASGDEEDASGDEEDASGDEEDASGDKEDASGDEEDASGDEEDASGDEEDASGGEEEDSGGEEEDSGGEEEDSGGEEEDSGGEEEDSGGEEEDSGGDEGGDEGGDDGGEE